VQRLAWVAAEAGKLQEEVTRAQADVITVRARTAQVEETVQEKAALLEDARGKEAEADERASALWGELVVTRREWDVTEEKVSNLATKAVMANQQ
jgi:isochorismate hydrolase